MTTYAYVFTVSLANGGSAPPYEVTGGPIALPSNTMQPILNAGDTITFVVTGRTLPSTNCTLYLRPLDGSSQSYPFVNNNAWQITIAATGTPGQYSSGVLTTQNSGPLSFAIGGVYQSTTNASVLIPFVVDPECEVGSSG